MAPVKPTKDTIGKFDPILRRNLPTVRYNLPKILILAR
jgi:hypothetical protein